MSLPSYPEIRFDTQDEIKFQVVARVLTRPYCLANAPP